MPLDNMPHPIRVYTQLVSYSALSTLYGSTHHHLAHPFVRRTAVAIGRKPDKRLGRALAHGRTPPQPAPHGRPPHPRPRHRPPPWRIRHHPRRPPPAAKRLASLGHPPTHPRRPHPHPPRPHRHGRHLRPPPRPRPHRLGFSGQPVSFSASQLVNTFYSALSTFY